MGHERGSDWETFGHKTGKSAPLLVPLAGRHVTSEKVEVLADSHSV